MEFVHYSKSHQTSVFIVKPDSSSQGRGIYLVKNPLDADSKAKEEEPAIHERTTDVIVQKYLGRPFLLDGYKFDFRVYVLVTSCNPLRAFVFKEGLVRLATCPYEQPTEKNVVGRHPLMLMLEFAQ